MSATVSGRTAAGKNIVSNWVKIDTVVVERDLGTRQRVGKLGALHRRCRGGSGALLCGRGRCGDGGSIKIVAGGFRCQRCIRGVGDGVGISGRERQGRDRLGRFVGVLPNPEVFRVVSRGGSYLLGGDPVAG